MCVCVGSGSPGIWIGIWAAHTHARAPRVLDSDGEGRLEDGVECVCAKMEFLEMGNNGIRGPDWPSLKRAETK